MKTYVRLIEDSYPFKKGTEFLVTSEDDGMWSLYAFYAGEVEYQGEKYLISVESDRCKYITKKDYKGKVFIEEEYLNPEPMSDAEYWEDRYNSPG